MQPAGMKEMEAMEAAVQSPARDGAELDLLQWLSLNPFPSTGLLVPYKA